MERNLLIVDDEDEILKSLTRELRKSYSVYAAHGAEEGFALLDRYDIHVILADQRMPGITGTGFFAQVRKDHPDATRLIMTGYTDIESIISSINDCHVFRYIRKPWNPDELDSVLREAFEHHDLVVSRRRLVKELEEVNTNLEKRVMERTAELEKEKARLENETAIRLRAEMVLKSNERLLSTLLDANRESIFMMDRNGVVLAMNNTCAARLRVDPGVSRRS